MATKTNKAFASALVSGFRAFGETQATLAQVVSLPVTRTASILSEAATALSGDVKTGETTGPFFDLRRSARRAAMNAGRMVKVNRATDGAITVKAADLADVTTDNGWSESDVKRAKAALEPKSEGGKRAPQQGKGAGKKGAGKGKADDTSDPVGGIDSRKQFAALSEMHQTTAVERAIDSLFAALEQDGRDPCGQAAQVAAYVADRAEALAERVAKRDAEQDAKAAA